MESGCAFQRGRRGRLTRVRAREPAPLPHQPAPNARGLTWAQGRGAGRGGVAPDAQALQLRLRAPSPACQATAETPRGAPDAPRVGPTADADSGPRPPN